MLVTLNPITGELRQHFAHQVIDPVEAEEFLGWLAILDNLVRTIAPDHDLMSFTDPGWTDLFGQDATLFEALDALADVDELFCDFRDFAKQRFGHDGPH